MTTPQMSLDLAGRPTPREILDRIREESRGEAEKGRWFEQLFMHIARQHPALEIDGIWRWNDWPEREELSCESPRDSGRASRASSGRGAMAGFSTTRTAPRSSSRPWRSAWMLSISTSRSRALWFVAALGRAARYGLWQRPTPGLAAAGGAGRAAV